MKSYCLKLPNSVIYGDGCMDSFGNIVSNCKKIAIFTDNTIKEVGLLDRVIDAIQKTEASYIIFSDIQPEPSYQDVQKIVDNFDQEGADVIVAVGGGSVMDTAKLASVCAGSDYSVKDLIDDPLLAKKKIDSIMIPTTAGTGSEATPNAIVAVLENEIKVGIVNECMIPNYVILDAEMIRNLPKKVAVATGIDALAHAIECYTGNKANCFSDLFALEALELIFKNIEDACNKQVMAAKEKMLIASFYAGVAIASSGTTAVHALSYPLGGKYHIPHGISNAILLVPVMRFNQSHCVDRLAEIYDRVNGTETLPKTEKSNWVIEKLDAIVKNLEVSCDLNEYGVSNEDLEILVENGMQVTRLLSNNPKEVTKEDARNIYKQIL